MAKYELDQAMMQRRHNKLAGREAGATSPEHGFTTEQHQNEAKNSRPTVREKSNENGKYRVTDASPVNLNNPTITPVGQLSTEQTS